MKPESVLDNEAVGVAFVGDASKLKNIVHKVDPELGIIILTEAREIPQENKPKVIGLDRLADISTTMVEVLFGHLSNYLGSKNQKDKIPAHSPEFGNFIGQSIMGTDPIVMDTALAGQIAEKEPSSEETGKGLGVYNIEKLKDTVDNFETDGRAEGPQNRFPNISVNLEVAVFYEGGAHIAHRGRSQQYHVAGSIKKITQDYITGGLLNVLDGTADFLPKIDHNSHQLKKGDRLVIFSQGLFPEGHKIDLKRLIGNTKLSPQNQAKEIVGLLQKYQTEHGYVIVIDANFEKKANYRSGDPDSLGKKPVMPKKKAPPIKGKASVSSTKRKVAKKDKSVASLLGGNLFANADMETEIVVDDAQIVEENALISSGVSAPENEMQQQFLIQLNELEERMNQKIEEKAVEIESRILLNLKEYQRDRAQRVTAITEPLSPEIEEPTTSLLSNSPEFQVHRPKMITVFLNELMKSIGVSVSIGKKVVRLPRKYKFPLIATPFVIMAAVAIYLSVNSPNNDSQKPQANESVKPSPIEKAIEEKKNSIVSQDSKDTVEEPQPKPRFVLGEVDTIKANYDYGRRLYSEGDTGKSRSGKRVGMEARIDALESALPYLDKATKMQNEKDSGNPDVWFVKARTEYNLAKFNHKKSHYAPLAVESYKTYSALAKRPSKSKIKTMKRNLKRLQNWI